MAKGFEQAFADARRAGKKTFTWNGKSYSTKMKSGGSGGSSSGGSSSSSSARRTPKSGSARGSTPTTSPAKPLPKVKEVGPRMGPTKSKSMTDSSKKSSSKSSGSGLVRGKTETKGGSYPSFQKDSVIAKDFRGAFAKARKEGKASFMWDGRKYTTKKKT